MKAYPALAAFVLLSACGAASTPPPGRAAPIPVPRPGMAALTSVMGQDAAGLIAQFGKPVQDVREGNARKLQFGGAICVFDAYLYPPASGRGDPIVTYTEARQRDGSPIDQSSCAAALRAGQARR